MKRLLIISLSAVLVIVGGCTQDTASVEFPSSPPPAAHGPGYDLASSPVSGADYSERSMIADLTVEDFQALYEQKGEPSFFVLINRELGDGNPAKLTMRELFKITNRSLTTGVETAAPNTVSGEGNVVVNIDSQNSGGGNNRDTETSMSVNVRDKTDLQLIDQARIEAAVAKAFRKFKIRMKDLDTITFTQGEENLVLSDWVDNLVLIKSQFDNRGVLGYTIKVINLSTGDILAHEAEAEVVDRYGKPFSLEGYETFFEQQGRKIVKGIYETWED